MPKLAHYKQSQISVNNYDPVYMNLFDVIITPPTSLAGSGHSDIVVEQIKQIGGLDTDKTTGSIVTQSFRGAERSFTSAKPTGTTVDLDFTVQTNIDDTNSIIGYKLYRDWQALAYNPRTGAMVMKKNYIGGPITIFLHNKEFGVIREWIFPTAIPGAENIKSMDLSFDSGDTIYELNYKFRCDYWDDIVVD